MWRTCSSLSSAPMAALMSIPFVVVIAAIVGTAGRRSVGWARDFISSSGTISPSSTRPRRPAGRGDTVGAMRTKVVTWARYRFMDVIVVCLWIGAALELAFTSVHYRHVVIPVVLLAPAALLLRRRYPLVAPL